MAEPGPLPDVRVHPSVKRDWRHEDIDDRHRAVLARARDLIELTRAWDHGLRGNKRIRYYESHYDLTLDQFRTHAQDPRLSDLFAWATRCAREGFGLLVEC